MVNNKITVEPGATKTIFLSFGETGSLINIAVVTGSVRVTLASSDVSDGAKKSNLPLKAGESVIVCAPVVRVSNATASDAKCEFGVIAK